MSACVLYHFAFDPGSRAVRLALGEAKKPFTEALVRPWEDDCPVAGLNPSGMPPVLQVTEDSRSLTLCEPAAILGWLEDGSRDPFLMPTDPAEPAAPRRLMRWFHGKFFEEVSGPLVEEKIDKRFIPAEYGGGAPNTTALRAARANIRYHLAYIGWLAARNDWLAGPQMSYADLAAANPSSRSATMSSIPSSPTARRTSPGVTPEASCSSGESC